jgi:trehalose-6-phosphatase
MGTWTAPALLDALKARLELRTNIINWKTQIATAPLGDETKPDAIVFFGAEGSQEWAALGKLAKDDMFRVEGAIWIVKPGAGETVAKAARDQATARLKELEDELRADPSVGSVVMRCEVQSHQLEQGTNTSGRWCQITFFLNVRQRI